MDINENFPVTFEDGSVAWISRSIAVLAMVFCNIHGKWHVLANKRGTGAADNVGLWNMPCGYLDYNETCKQAAAREVYEECGVTIPEDKFLFTSYNDQVTENRQNVTLRFRAVLDERDDNISISTGLNTRGGEPDEVSSIQWVELSSIDSLTWAFNHDNLIRLYSPC